MLANSSNREVSMNAIGKSVIEGVLFAAILTADKGVVRDGMRCYDTPLLRQSPTLNHLP